MAQNPSFSVAVSTEIEPEATLMVGLADLGVAGLSAVNYLITQTDTTQIGHIRSSQLPGVTPVEDGRPRHPIRLFDCEEADLTILVCEVFLPVGAAEPFVEALLEWVNGTGITEVIALQGLYVRHSEDEHVVLRAGTDDFHDRHFGSRQPEQSSIEPLSGGLFDGVVGELLTRSLAEEAPPVGALVTPAHPPGPDLEGAIRLIEAVESVSGLAVDGAALREEAREMERHFEELAHRMRTLQKERGRQEYPEDRMFM